MQPGQFRSYFGAICIPTIDQANGQISTVTHDWANAAAGLGGGLAVTVLRLNVKNRDVATAKQALAEMAVANNCQWVFFLDDDVIPPGDALMKMINRWKQDPKYQIQNGVYWSKSEPPLPLIFKGSFKGSYMDWKVGDLIEADAAGAGCTFIATDVFKNLPKPWFSINYVYDDVRQDMDLNRWNMEDELNRLLRGGELNEYTAQRVQFLQSELLKLSKQMNEMEKTKGIDPRQLLNSHASASTTEDLYFYKKAKEVLDLSCWVDTSIQCIHQDKRTGQMFGIRPDFPQARPNVPTPVKTGKLALDVGCGEMGPHFQDYDVVRLDLDPDSKPEENNVPFILADARQIPVQDCQFDLVHASHVLEHFSFKWTRNVLKEWIRTLKVGGKLVIVVPNLVWASRNILNSEANGINAYEAERSMFMYFSAQKDGARFDYHKAGFTPRALQQLLESIDLLENVEVHTSDGGFGNWDEENIRKGDYNIIAFATKKKHDLTVSIHENLRISDQEGMADHEFFSVQNNPQVAQLPQGEVEKKQEPSEKVEVKETDDVVTQKVEEAKKNIVQTG